MAEPELLTVEDAARACQVGRSTMYEWIAEGIVPTFRVHGVVRIPRSALTQMIEDQVQAATRSRATGPAATRSGEGSR